MRFPWKNTHTLIGSWISIIIIIITLIKAEGQGVVYAYDPLSVPNNKFGIHIIQATPDESSPAASLVNSSGGDWGYITVLIEGKDKNQGKWQEFFNDLRRRHLIPIVRLATIPDGGVWKIPDIGEASVWADFLDALNWPTKNRYIVIYNEPNHATEWGGLVDAKLYAETLDKTITAIKTKNRDFFVLNGGFDASAPSQPPLYEDEIIFLQQMEQAMPGILSKLDGWVSHSYPNPAFLGSPYATGRGTVRTWLWELQVLRSLGVSKSLPVFITETGWKHAEGLTSDPFLPTAATISQYYKQAFESAWNYTGIAAVTPFLLSYQEYPFDHFSFKKVGELGYYTQYQTISDIPKVFGRPIQENKTQLVKGEIFSSIVSGQSYDIFLTFKNTGQSIWGEQIVKLIPIQGGRELGIDSQEIAKDTKIEPGQEYTFNLKIKAPLSGKFKVVLNLFNDGIQFDSPPFEFETEVKQPVILQVKSALKWKKQISGEYLLIISGAVGESEQKVYINEGGVSDEIEARYLLPDYTFDFTLNKSFYKPSTFSQNVHAGINVLDFGSLQPDIFSALLHPKELWKLLPFSN